MFCKLLEHGISNNVECYFVVGGHR